MGNYELTERGKIIIAVILVLLLLVLPSTILVVMSWDTSPPPADDPSHSIVPEPDPPDDSPVISDRPLPDGSGFNPDDPPEIDDNEDDPADTPEEQPYDLPEFGPISINRTDGTMLFLFAPELQDALDPETAALLGELIASPKKTDDAQIVIEIPLLSDEDTTKLISAIADAFAEHGITQRELAYIVYQSETEDRSHEVRLSIVDDTTRK